jgi:thymidylate synthase (FAD)
MKLINPTIEVISPLNGEEILRHCELAIRNCYKSEDKIGADSHKKLVQTILDSHHYSTIEHFSITVRVICSRACLAQWTRHRHFSFSVESQRYCNYSRSKFDSGITFIKPQDYYKYTTEQRFLFDQAMESCETQYLGLIAAGLKAQEARNTLNNAVKTEMVVTANLRAWRDFLQKRTDKSAQDEIRYLSNEILTQFQTNIPVIFDNLTN